MRAVPAGVALAWVLVASTSAAQPAEPDHVQLDFTAGASCPDARTFRNFVASSLGGAIRFVDDARSACGWSCGGRGPRTSSQTSRSTTPGGKAIRREQEIANDCASLVQLVAVLVAAWVMPVAVGKPAAPAEPPPPVEASGAAGVSCACALRSGRRSWCHRPAPRAARGGSAGTRRRHSRSGSGPACGRT